MIGERLANREWKRVDSPESHHSSDDPQADSAMLVTTILFTLGTIDVGSATASTTLTDKTYGRSELRDGYF